MRRIPLFLLLFAYSTSLFAEGYRLIAHPSVPTTTLTKKEAAEIFRKKSLKWGDGTPVIAVDQLPTAAVRESFTKDVHGKSVAAIRNFWQQQIFSGRDVPPVEVKSDSEVLQFVRSKPGAIGYISDSASSLAGVKTIDVR